MNSFGSYILVGLVFVTCVLIYPGWQDFSSAPRLMLLSLVLPGLAWLVGVRINVFAALLLAWAGLSLGWSLVWWEAINGLWMLVLLLLSIGLGARLMPAQRDLVFVGAALGIGLSSISALMQAAFGLWLPEADWVKTLAAVLVDGPWAAWVFPVWMHGHPGGLFFNKNMLAESAALVCVWAVWQRRWVLCGVLAPSIILPMSLGAWTALAAGLSVMVLPRAWPLPMLGAGALAAWWNPASLEVRLQIWESALEGWWMKPWGHGIGQFYALFPVFHADTLVSRPDHAHNVFVEVLFELGVPGLVLYLTVLAVALARSAGVARGLVVCGLSLGMVGFPLATPVAMLLCGLVLGHALRPRGVVCWSRLVEPQIAHASYAYK